MWSLFSYCSTRTTFHACLYNAAEQRDTCETWKASIQNTGSIKDDRFQMMMLRDDWLGPFQNWTELNQGYFVALWRKRWFMYSFQSRPVSIRENPADFFSNRGFVMPSAGTKQRLHFWKSYMHIHIENHGVHYAGKIGFMSWTHTNITTSRNYEFLSWERVRK